MTMFRTPDHSVAFEGRGPGKLPRLEPSRRSLRDPVLFTCCFRGSLPCASLHTNGYKRAFRFLIHKTLFIRTTLAAARIEPQMDGGGSDEGFATPVKTQPPAEAPDSVLRSEITAVFADKTLTPAQKFTRVNELRGLRVTQALVSHRTRYLSTHMCFFFSLFLSIGVCAAGATSDL